MKEERERKRQRSQRANHLGESSSHLEGDTCVEGERSCDPFVAMSRLSHETETNGRNQGDKGKKESSV